MRCAFLVAVLNLFAVVGARAQMVSATFSSEPLQPSVYAASAYEAPMDPIGMPVVATDGYEGPYMTGPEPLCDPSWCESPYRDSAWRIELGIIPTSSQVSDQAFGDWDHNGGLGMRLMLGHEDCEGLGIRAVLWGFGQEVDTTGGDVELGASTFDLDLYKRFFIEDGELVVGGGSVGGHLKYELDAMNQSAEFRGGGISIFGEGFYPFVRFQKTDIGQVARARISLLSGRWDDNGTAFMSDTRHDTMTILNIAWGLELRRRFGRMEDKYWYVAIVPEFQRWESASLPNAFDPGFQGTNFNFGLAW
jgi:hypothetical protein